MYLVTFGLFTLVSGLLRSHLWMQASGNSVILGDVSIAVRLSIHASMSPSLANHSVSSAKE